MKLRMKLFVLLMFSVAAIGWNGAVADAAAKSFSDVKSSHWAKKEIDYLVGLKVINGYPDGRYGVGDSITRAQAATMIMRSFGWSGEWDDPGYTDVRPGKHWAYNDIAAVYHMDIFKPEGKFQPELAVTRAEMADMLVKAYNLDSIKAGKFEDLNPDHWAYQSINILSGSNITSGYSDGTFRPEAKVTRAEFAVFMTRVHDEQYRLKDKHAAHVEGVIYDLEVGGQYVQLNDPLLLMEQWFAPVELFEKLGYYAESFSANRLTLASTTGEVLELGVGQHEVWVGETSVELDRPLIKHEGKFYIEAHGILTAMEKPLVFYPSEFLIRLEKPSITSADIIKQMPQAGLKVIHGELPYWHWSKRDRDYMELIKKNNQVASKRTQLQQEMKQLTQAYFQVEQEKTIIKGITYYSDNVTGKLDAISRGIEARYLLLNEASKYSYPAVGTSGAIGHFGLNNRYEFDYVVYDHLFDHYEPNKQQLINSIQSFTAIDLELFKGLMAHGIPFFIREKSSNGEMNTWAGLASGSHAMLVVNSGLSTFYHELGHNWDAMLGDHEEYLKLRGRSDYKAQSSDWADRVGENFAEDFAIAFMPGADITDHQGVFGAPTEAEVEAFRAWVKQRSQAAAHSSDETLVNGASLLPSVINVADGKLRVEGHSGHHTIATITNTASGEQSTIDLTAGGSSYSQTLQLPQKGIYSVVVGRVQMIVVYD